MRTKMETKPKAMWFLSMFLVFVMLITTQGFMSVAGTVSENEMTGENAEQINDEQTNEEQIDVEQTDAEQPENQSVETEEEGSDALPQAISTSENSIQAGSGTPADPVHNCTKQNDGTDTTTWSYVYFGSYPQSEVTDTAIITAIDSTILVGNGTTAYAGTDVWVNGTKYRRISKSDTNNDEYFDEATNNGYRYFKWERIKWRVLDNNGSTLFVVADKGLDCKNYNDVKTYITWENSTIREWLNNSFYNTAFSSNERNAIVAQNVVNDDNLHYDSEGGNNTTDKVYLLSIDEVTKESYGFCSEYDTYSASRWMQPSNYARARGALKIASGIQEGNSVWWLRSPGWGADAAANVLSLGFVSRSGQGVVKRDETVSPALHINLSSDIWFMTDDGTSGDGGGRILTAFTVVKAKTTYNQGESLNVDDLEVTAKYDKGTSRSVAANEYTTNAKTIDMNTPGKKTLTVSYTENNITKTADITITVNKTETKPSIPGNKENPETPEKPASSENTASTVEAEEEKVISTNTDKGDVAGSKFYKLRLKATGKTKSVKLTWKKVKDADGYIIYGARCGQSMKKIKTIIGNKKVTYTQKKLKKGKYYKYMVVAYKTIDGKKYTIATSKSAHAVTKGGKYGNPTKVSVKSSKMTIKVGKKKTIKASYTLPKGKKASIHIAKFRYESTNTKVATVTKKGVVKAKKKGSAYIYVYAQNGVYKKVKITVK
ncbi:MAG: bacterial Ig-like domain-containing protein [Lachnospiraceae bacterium]|nr:bacterial Ig-like domain-containing protein [Lachnospiraceae bacterium]